MTGKLPKGAGDFSVAASRGVGFEEAIFLGEAEFETSAARFDDWPNMSAAAVAIKIRAAAGSSKRIRRNLLIVFLPPNILSLRLVIAMSLFDVWLGHSYDVIKAFWERIKI
jgi:hypothetical protein